MTELKPKIFTVKDLSSEDKVKVKDTINYSLSQNPNQTREEVREKCWIAVASERMIADHFDGYINSGIENLKDPHTYAYDVLCHPRFSGLRVEVKTHQSGSKWISCSSGAYGLYPGNTGINLGPFLEFAVSDLIIILKADKVSPGAVRLTPFICADKNAFNKKSGLVVKSNHTGWYISERIAHSFDQDHLFKLFT